LFIKIESLIKFISDQKKLDAYNILDAILSNGLENSPSPSPSDQSHNHGNSLLEQQITTGRHSELPGTGHQNIVTRQDVLQTAISNHDDVVNNERRQGNV